MNLYDKKFQIAVTPIAKITEIWRQRFTLKPVFILTKKPTYQELFRNS